MGTGPPPARDPFRANQRRGAGRRAQPVESAAARLAGLDAEATARRSRSTLMSACRTSCSSSCAPACSTSPSSMPRSSCPVSRSSSSRRNSSCWSGRQAGMMSRRERPTMCMSTGDRNSPACMASSGSAGFSEPGPFVGLGPLGLSYILRVGGSGYFRRGRGSAAYSSRRARDRRRRSRVHLSGLCRLSRGKRGTAGRAACIAWTEAGCEVEAAMALRFERKLPQWDAEHGMAGQPWNAGLDMQ